MAAEQHHIADGQQHWVDYNAQPPGDSRLPALPPMALASFGLALFVLLAVIVTASINISRAQSSSATTQSETPAQH